MVTGDVVVPTCVETDDGETDMLKSGVGGGGAAPPPQPLSAKAIVSSENDKLLPQTKTYRRW